MAARKETIWQTDFSLGAVRPEAEERDDTSLIERSIRQASNTIGLTTGQLEQRPGTLFENATAATEGVEVDLGSGRVYELHLIPEGLKLYASDGTEAASFTSNTWTTIADKFGTFTFDDISFWVVPSPDDSSILIGSRYFPTQALVVSSAGVWSFGALAVQTNAAGAQAIPFWRHYPGVTVQPSGRTGAITVTASAGIWTDDHNGLVIRYVDRQIVLGSRVSATVMNATVTEELPEAWNITVASVSGYQLGDAVEHSTLGGQGIITAIAGSIITVLTTSSFDGFAASGNLTAPNANQAISAIASTALPASSLWDIQLASNVHGYAGHAVQHTARLFQCDFPGAPQAVAASVAGSINDFTMGANDADGFAEILGADKGGDLLYVVSAEDLLFFTTRGIYYQGTRDGSAITPQSFRPVSFTRIGCARVRPVTVDDGAIFVDAVGKQVQAAVLSGDIYKNWRVRHLSKYHPHLMSSPSYLGATQSGGVNPEQFIYAINSDGTAAVCQWDREEDVLSWRPWSTPGSFVSIYQALDRIHAVVDRTINGVSVRYRERFEDGIYLDCAACVEINDANPEGQAGQAFFAGVTAFATHLDGHTSTGYFEGWDMGDRAVNSAGKLVDGNAAVIPYPDYDGIAQIGLVFGMTLEFWSRRSLRTQRGVRDIKKTVAVYATVQDTREVEIEGRSYFGYRVGEDLTMPPPARSEQIKVNLLAGGPFRRVSITKPRPGPFRLLKVGYRVVI